MKLNKLITSTILICACIFSFTACQNDDDAYSYDCVIFMENKPISEVVVLINGVDTGIKSSASGKVSLTGLSNGDVITFEKDGCICLSKIKVPDNLNEKTIIMFDRNMVELKPVNPIPSVSTNIEIIEKEDGKFSIKFDQPKGYVFNGYYINNSLVSTDENYVFAKSMRGDVTIKFSKIYSLRIMSYDGVTTLYDKDVISGEEIKLSDCIEINDVFLGWYEGGKLLSSDIDYRYKIKGDSTLFVKTEKPKLNLVENGREITINGNVEYEILLDGVKIASSGNVIKITDYTKRSGKHVVTVTNRKYDITTSITVVLENEKVVSNANVILANGKYYLISDGNLTGCNLILNDTKYGLNEQNGVYYVDISKEIVDGENVISLASEDEDGVVSSVTMARYVKYYTPSIPKITIENGILKLAENNYNAKLYVNKVLVGEIGNEGIEVTNYNGELAIELSGEYINTIYYTVDRNQLYRNRNNNIEIIESEDEIYLSWGLPSGVREIVLSINGMSYNIGRNETSANITTLLVENENNYITLTIKMGNEDIVNELIYYYSHIENIRFNYKNGILHIINILDYCKVKINGILLNNMFITQNIDINYYILSNCRLDIEIFGYDNGRLVAKGKIEVDYEKHSINKEYAREITLKGNKYLAVEFLTDGEYYLVKNDKYISVKEPLVKLDVDSYDLIVKRGEIEMVLFSK